MTIIITAFNTVERSVTYTVNGGSPITRTGLGEFASKADVAAWIEAISSTDQELSPLPDMSEFMNRVLPTSDVLEERSGGFHLPE